MTIVIRCDICKRACDPDEALHGTVVITWSNEHTLHICTARDGADIGCIGHLRAGIVHAQKAAADWLEENRPEEKPR